MHWSCQYINEMKNIKNTKNIILSVKPSKNFPYQFYGMILFIEIILFTGMIFFPCHASTREVRTLILLGGVKDISTIRRNMFRPRARFLWENEEKNAEWKREGRKWERKKKRMRKRIKKEIDRESEWERKWRQGQRMRKIST